MAEITRNSRIKEIIKKLYRESDGTESSPENDEIESEIALDESKWGNITKTDNFIGREEEMLLIEKAITEHKKIIQVTGIDGIGKSEICRQLFCKYADIYTAAEDKTQALYPVFMHYEYNLDDTFVNVINYEKNIKYYERVDRVWRYFDSLTKQKKMIIFVDGVNKTLLEDESLNKLYSLNCTTVVSSIDNIFLNSPDLCRIRVASLNDKEALGLFLSIYDKELYDQDMEDVSYITKELADNHSLTVKLLASMAKYKNWEISDLINCLEDCNFKMSAIFLYSDDLEILIEEYRKLLMIMDFSDAEKSILEAFALLPYDEYTLKFCLDWMESDSGTYEFGIIIDKLCEKAWLEKDDELHYSMNNVVASVIINVLAPKIEKHMHIVKMCDKYLQLYALRIHDDKHPYWRVAENIVNEMYNEGVYSLGQLATRAGTIFLGRMEYERARSLYRRSVVIYENIFGRDHLETALAYYNLAQTYEKCGDFNNAMTHYNVALEIQEATFMGKEQEYTGNTYESMAKLFFKKGKYESAIRYYTRSLEIKEKQLGRENLSVALVYTEMAEVFTEMKNYDMSLSYYNIAMDIRQKLLGKQNVLTIQVYANIAGVYRKLNDYINSIKYYKKAIELYEKEYGKEHLYISYAYNGMAGAYAKQGKYEKAKQCCSKSIEMCERLFGKKSMAIATAYNNMALICKEGREFDKSEKYFALSLNIVEKIMGTDNIHSAQIYKGMGNIYKVQKKYDKALSYYEKAAVIRKNLMGSAHPDTLDMLEKIDAINKIVNEAKVVKIVESEEKAKL